MHPPCEAARTARYRRLGLTATAGCYRHMSALRRGAVHWARPGREQLWRQPPTPFGSSPPCALSGGTPPVQAAFLPSSAEFGFSSLLLKLTPAASTLQLSTCISHHAVLSSGYFPTQAWICSPCQFPRSRPTVTLAAAHRASLPWPRAAREQRVTFHFSSCGTGTFTC